MRWDAIPSTYPNSLDFESGSYTLVDPVQYETVHVGGKYGVKVNIKNVTPKDFGLYTCYVSNHLGSDYRSAFLSERKDRWKESEGKNYTFWLGLSFADVIAAKPFTCLKHEHAFEKSKTERHIYING